MIELYFGVALGCLGTLFTLVVLALLIIRQGCSLAAAWDWLFGKKEDKANV